MGEGRHGGDDELFVRARFAVCRRFQIGDGVRFHASNNVQIAFGRDSDADGVLSAGETGMILAWDCGEWILFGTNALPFAVSSAVDTNAHKVLRWELHLRGKRPKSLVLTENDQLLFSDFASAPEPWFYGRDWNMFRLTARGIDNPAESFVVDLNEKGALILLR